MTARTTPTSRRPKISVCVPVYNGGAYIGECIESVLAQTFDDLTVIVCDNCSTDNTEDVVRSYDDARVRYVRNERNLGLVGNANRCLELADGEYVCIFHHDDVMLPANLARKVALLDERRDVGFVHSNMLLIDQSGAVVEPEIWAEESRRDYVEHGPALFERFVMRMPYGASVFIGAVVARRSCYEAVGGFREELPHCSDSEMWMRMLLFFDAACIGEPLLKYRIHPGSGSSAFGDYTSLPYLREHHQAVSLIFERYSPRIPARRQLWNAVAQIFASRMIDLALLEMTNGSVRRGLASIGDAIRAWRPIVWSPRFWIAAGGAVAGRRGVGLYRRVKMMRRADESSSDSG